MNVAKAFKLKDHILPEQVEKIQGLFTPVHQKGQNKQKFTLKTFMSLATALAHKAFI